MSRRPRQSAAVGGNVALGSTGQPRRDRETQAVFARLCGGVPLLATNPSAKAQLTGIVFGGLVEMRRTSRSAELCGRSLSDDGCTHCSWRQKAFCEACGTDFARARSRTALPLFLPSAEDDRLHIDVCMLCSEACVDRMIARQAELEAAKDSAAGTPARLTRSAADPHLSAFSAIFHASAYLTTLYTLFLADYTLSSVPFYLTAWNLLAQLALHGLWLLNLLQSWSSGGGVSSVYKMRQALSLLCSVNVVLCVGMTLIYWTLSFVHAAAIRTPDDPTTIIEDQLKHTLPIIIMAVEVYSFPHVKVSRTLERLSCITLPSLFLVASWYKRYYSVARSWPYPFFAVFEDQLRGSTYFAAFAIAAITLLAAITYAFQTIRDRIWAAYIVPKHLQLQVREPNSS